METKHQQQMRLLAKTSRIVKWLDCGLSLDQAIYEEIQDYHDRQEFLFILKNFDPSTDIDKLLANVKSKVNMPSANVYFW